MEDLSFGTLIELSHSSNPSAFPLVQEGRAVPPLVDNGDFEVVHMAARAFGQDVNAITGVAPVIQAEIPPSVREMVIINCRHCLLG